METKLCPKCRQTLPATTDYFHKNNKCKYGLACWCKTCTNELLKKRYRDLSKEDKQKYYAKVIQYKDRYKGKYRQYATKARLKLKTEVLTHYGKNGTLECCWEGCGVRDIDMLSLDHVDNNGAEHRRQMKSCAEIYRKLRKQNWPSGFQTMCFNHQWKKHLIRLKNNGLSL